MKKGATRTLKGSCTLRKRTAPEIHPVCSVEKLIRAASQFRSMSDKADSFGDETTVVKTHSGNGEHDEMNRRAIACFDLALADVGLANDDV